MNTSYISTENEITACQLWRTFFIGTLLAHLVGHEHSRFQPCTPRRFFLGLELALARDDAQADTSPKDLS